MPFCRREKNRFGMVFAASAFTRPRAAVHFLDIEGQKKSPVFGQFFHFLIFYSKDKRRTKTLLYTGLWTSSRL